MEILSTEDSICDAIKQNESELECNEIVVFHYNMYFNLGATFCWKSHQNWTHGSRDAQNNKIQRELNTIINYI